MSTQLIQAVGQRTDPGRVRDHNEDSLATVPLESVSPEVLKRKGHVFLVADGMGGHAAGATASGIAVQQIMRAYYRDDSDDRRASLERAIRLANAAIFDQAREDPVCAGMGTTLVGLILQDSRFLAANVGDSRAYLVRDGGIRQLTQDHSWVGEAVRQGTISAEQARHHPRRNVITRSLGNRPDVEVDFFEEGLLPSDVFVLCSDGLSGPVYDEEIRDAVLAMEPQVAAEQLVNLANERGGPDNITVVIVRVVQVMAAVAPKAGRPLVLAVLGCLGVTAVALGLAFAAAWALGGIPAFPPIAGPTATATAKAVSPTVVSPIPGTVSPIVAPESTLTPAPSAIPQTPLPTGTSVPYPPASATPSATASPSATAVVSPSATTVIPPSPTATGPSYPSPAAPPVTVTPGTPIVSPTVMATSTVTPTATVTATATVTGTVGL